MPHITKDVSTRFSECVQVLIESGRAVSDEEIAQTVSLPKAELNSIRSGSMTVTRRWIVALVEKYQINPIYLYLAQGRPLIGFKLKLDDARIEESLRVARAKEPGKV